MNFERQLQSIADKDSLHKWIDSLPETAKGVFVVDVSTDDDADQHLAYGYLGNDTLANSLWLIEHFKHHLMFS